MLLVVHPTIRAVRFLFPVGIVQYLCQLSGGKLNGSPLNFGTRVVDIANLLQGWTANPGVTHVAARKRLLEALPFVVGVMSGEWESFSACPIHPGWCHVVPDDTSPAMYRTKEPVFLRGAASPPPYMQELPTQDLESDESLRDLRLHVVRVPRQSQDLKDGVSHPHQLLRHLAGRSF